MGVSVCVRCTRVAQRVRRVAQRSGRPRSPSPFPLASSPRPTRCTSEQCTAVTTTGGMAQSHSYTGYASPLSPPLLPSLSSPRSPNPTVIITPRPPHLAQATVQPAAHLSTLSPVAPVDCPSSHELTPVSLFRLVVHLAASFDPTASLRPRPRTPAAPTKPTLQHSRPPSPTSVNSSQTLTRARGSPSRLPLPVPRRRPRPLQPPPLPRSLHAEPQPRPRPRPRPRHSTSRRAQQRARQSGAPCREMQQTQETTTTSSTASARSTPPTSASTARPTRTAAQTLSAPSQRSPVTRTGSTSML